MQRRGSGRRSWVGSMRNNVRQDGAPEEGGGLDGVLYRVDSKGRASEWRRDLGIANTLLWSPDDRGSISAIR